MSRTSPFSSLFGKSPFHGLQNHMRQVNQCAAEVVGLMAALGNEDGAAVEAARERIFTMEAEADKIKNSIRANLPKSLFLPVDRRDLLEILDFQDSIADTAQDIAGLLSERKMTVPVGMAGPLNVLTQRCVDACVHLTSIIEQLDELVQAGFGGREAESVQEMITNLARIEDDTDRLGMDLTRNLFANEDSIKPVSVMFWYQLIQWIGDLADYSQKVGDRLRLLIAR